MMVSASGSPPLPPWEGGGCVGAARFWVDLGGKAPHFSEVQTQTEPTIGPVMSGALVHISERPTTDTTEPPPPPPKKTENSWCATSEPGGHL